MINEKDNYAAWALLLTGLNDARGHLDELIKRMNIAGSIDESVFAVDLGHIYAHLNRAWHSRDQASEIAVEQWDTFSQFPKDLEPVG